MSQEFDTEDFAFFTGVAFMCLLILVFATAAAWAGAQVVGVLLLYAMFATSAGIGYYVTAHTNL